MSESRLRDFASVAPVWFWEQSAELRLSWISPAPPNQRQHEHGALGKLRWDCVDTSGEPDDWNSHKQDLLARRAFSDFRYHQPCADGTVRYFSISGRPLFDDAGGFLGYRGIGRDITAQIEMEAERDGAREHALRAEALLHDALDSLPESVLICDAQDRLQMTNEAFRRWFPRRSAAGGVGKSFEETMRTWLAAGEYPEARGQEETWLANRMRHHHAAAGGFERQLPGGGWARVTERRMRSGGTVTLHVAITDLKRTEIALRRSEERLDLAQSVAGIGTWELDLQTNA